MVAIYTRQSVDRKDSISIDSQIEFCRREAGTENTAVYTDRGYSGKNTNRPDFEKLLDDVKKGKITKVIVYRLDRISRSLLDFARIIDLFNEHGIEFLSCTEKFDTSAPIGKAMLSIIMVFAQLERETIQERVITNYYERGRQGMYIGGRAPYGLRKIETCLNGKKTYTFEEIPEQVRVLREIYSMYIRPDTSLGTISRYLNKLEIPAAQGGNWDTCKLSRIMHNPVYVRADADVYLYYKSKGCILSNSIEDFIGINGCYLYGKRKASDRKYTNIENHTLSLALHEGIIDSRTFLLCQHKLSTNKRIANAGKSKYSWLSGKLRCGYCGSSVTTSSQYNGVYYLSCTGKKLRQDCDGLGRTLKVPDVEAVVEAQIFTLCNSNRILKRRVRESKEPNAGQDRQLKIIDEKIDNLLEQIAAGNAIVTKYINEKIEALEKEKRALLEATRQDLVDTAMGDANIFQVINIVSRWQSLSLEEKKQVAGQMIEKVEIIADSVQITWTKAFDLV
ncbi:MAG: recombinase family protein [Oscillospiraceae bacterium]|jgi:DNA invertase Pin-like site-specific DNA recombinase|nr:recombinase family protein [Oscillospiraceae bacterium]